MFRSRGRQATAIAIGLTVIAITSTEWAIGQSVTDARLTDLNQPDAMFATQPSSVVQPTPQPEAQPSPRRQTTPRRRSVTRRPQFRLASVPNMFGDIFLGSGGLSAINSDIAPFGLSVTACSPLAGGARRNKIGENNKALPMNRVYFMYNRYADALLLDTSAFGGPTREFAVDKFTVGLERTLCDGLYSVDVRMPFTSDYDFFSLPFGIQAGNIGNLAVALKRSLYQSDFTSVVAGLGLDLPTGSDVRGRMGGPTFTFNNDAVLIQPFLGLLAASEDDYFFHGFIQVDVPTHGNRIDFQIPAAGTSGTVGRYNDQTLLYLDLAAGKWLYQAPRSCGVSGLAALVELHYATALQDSDIISANIDPGASDTTLTFGGSTNRFNTLNVAFGLDAEVGLTNFRVGAVFPLTDGPNRMFDSEIQAQINRRY